jgi:hypothetical protein
MAIAGSRIDMLVVRHSYQCIVEDLQSILVLGSGGWLCQSEVLVVACWRLPLNPPNCKGRGSQHYEQHWKCHRYADGGPEPHWYCVTGVFGALWWCHVRFCGRRNPWQRVVVKVVRTAWSRVDGIGAHATETLVSFRHNRDGLIGRHGIEQLAHLCS